MLTVRSCISKMTDLFPDLQQQLNKLSVYKKPMQFQVTKIEFDGEDDGYVLCDHEDPLQTLTQDDIIEEVQARTWEVIDEDDLVDEITNVVGWCIKSIDYLHVLS